VALGIDLVGAIDIGREPLHRLSVQHREACGAQGLS
jgi:hypothetical protein